MNDFGYPTEFSDMVGLLRHRAEATPNQIAFVFLVDGEGEEEVITYAELDRQARAVAATLQARLDTYDRVLVIYPQGLAYLAALFGCMYAKTLAIPLQPPDPRRLERTLPKLESIVKDGGVKLVLTTEQMLSGAQGLLPRGSALAGVPWVGTDTMNSALAERWVPPAILPTDMAYLQYTSGSTSSPKGVIVSHLNLVHNLTDFCVDYGHDAHSIIVTWLPTFHDLGLVYGVFMPVFRGFKGVILDPMAFLARPIRWLRAISHYRGTHSPAPNFAYDICVSKTSEEDRVGLDLSCWKVALNGAEPIRYESEARFVDAYAPYGVTWSTLSHAYGMSETTAKIASEPHDSEPEFVWADPVALEENRVVDVVNHPDPRVLASCGTTDTDTTVVIANTETFAQLPDDRVGEIWVGGTTITQGYWERPDATREVYGVRLSDTGEGPYFRTGDLGFTRGGRVFVTGRLKDMIIIRGENHYPQDIEWDVQFSHNALRPNSIAAFSITDDGRERVVVVSEAYGEKLAGHQEEVFAAVREAVAEHGIQVSAIQLIPARSIFKTSSGKIMRGRVKMAWLNGEFRVQAEWKLPTNVTAAPKPATEGLVQRLNAVDSATKLEIIVERVVSLAAEILGLPEDYIEPNRPLRELGFDSVQAVELAEALGNSIGQMLPATALFDYPTCEELANYMLGEWFVEAEAEGSSAEVVQASSSKPVEEMTDEELEAALLAELNDL